MESRKTKVVFVSSCLMASGGGAPVSEAGLVEALRQCCDVTLLCHRTRYRTLFADRFAIRDLVFTYQGTSALKLLFGLGTLRYLFEAAEVIHINGHWRWENAIFGLVARRLGKPYVLHPRGMFTLAHRSRWKKRLFNFVLGRNLIKGARAVIALSNFESRHFDRLPVSKERIEVIPNGIDRVDDREKSNGSGDYFLYFGRIEARKNLLFLLDAFAEYLKMGGNKPLVLMGPVERDYDKQVLKRAEELGIAPVVHLSPADYGEHKALRIKGAIAVVYPALEEAFGRVPFEALSFGVAPIVPRESGAADYLAELFPENLYSAESVQGLAGILKRIEEHPPSQEQLIRGVQWVDEVLNWQRVAQVVFRLYKTALEKNDDRRNQAIAV